jgi:hypothetical protein
MKLRPVFAKILIALAVIVIGFLIVVATRPSDMRITRSATMSADAPMVFAQVNDFHNWQAWSPWEKLDPDMQRTYEGPTSGEGAVYTWSGNSDVGEGRMTLTDSRPDELVRIKLEFIKPFAATNTTEFQFEPRDGQTEVTWTMTGQNNFMSKAFGLFVDMDKMIGNDFEKGLNQMKAVVEAKAGN